MEDTQTKETQAKDTQAEETQAKENQVKDTQSKDMQAEETRTTLPAAGAKMTRDPNLDLIRCVAFFLLPSVHFFLHTGFYNVPLTGGTLYFMTAIRTMSMMCVPLFLLITGYLMSGKQYSKGYFKGIIRILIIFFLCKAAITVYKCVWMHSTVTAVDFIKSLSSGEEYSWYVGLYMWLYCLIPLLNIIFHSMDEKWKKQALLLASIGLIILPGFANFYKADMPDTFSALYPVAYYYIGAYIREEHASFRTRNVLVLFLFSVLLSTAVNILISHDQNFVWNVLNDWRGFENVLMATFLFLLLRKLDLGHLPKAVVSIMARFSKWSFGAYLLSWIFDAAFYPKLNTAVPDVTARMKYYVIMVPLVIICSLLLSAVINLIYRLLCALCSRIVRVQKEEAA